VENSALRAISRRLDRRVNRKGAALRLHELDTNDSCCWGRALWGNGLRTARHANSERHTRQKHEPFGETSPDLSLTENHLRARPCEMRRSDFTIVLPRRRAG